MFPPVPVSCFKFWMGSADKFQGASDRERLSAHSEVVALQQRLGISYKDASHRLYMAELEKVKRDQYIYKSFTILENMTTKTLELGYGTIRAINGQETR